ncbi:uncharacterized protein FIBRA_01529 [Fibroporia radiculosa]|uniref:DNA replication regulator Sld3 C-terminal domain-containing protein n=1 Tax=Fibroporia radiculosa TaxID=599839 RepID=J4I8J3_9APHY|nr:uncharacterized protein FIBRA_01529 [Fibroporia radiculosa]CCL99511.1 predicted protein [Fibroporia radiculosa]
MNNDMSSACSSKSTADPHLTSLPLESPVKWTAAQERSINKDHPLNSLNSSETPKDYVMRTYLQFLWLPKSVAPLRLLVPALLRVTTWIQTISNPTFYPSHPLHDALRPLLLAPRDAAEKYHVRINQIIDDDAEGGNLQENMMWFAYKNEMLDEDEAHSNESQFDLEERWKNRWLSGMEQREVQIQIILHLLLLSLPSSSNREISPSSTLELPAHLSPLKNRKRKKREPTPPPPELPLEERIERLMDRLSVWQLVAKLDAEPAQRDRSTYSQQDKGKQKASNERDWMQIFCEDVVERLFKDKLPEQCALLRSKVSLDSSFSDDTDLVLSSSSPSSPRHKSKRLKSATSSRSASRLDFMSSDKTARSQNSKKGTKQSRPQDLQRSRSLSMSLEEERARSASIGPGSLRKPLLTREVSMTTAFKGKAQARQRERAAAAARAKTTQRRKPALAVDDVSTRAKAKESIQGVTLVAATPVKSKPRTSQSKEAETSQFDLTLPPLPMCDLSAGMEGDGDDEDWTLASSPDVLMLRSSSQGAQDFDSEDDEEELSLGNRMERELGGRVLVTGTPTKKQRLMV